MKKEKKWTPHIIAVMAFSVFIVLGLACASTQMGVEELKAWMLNPERNKFNLELKMADTNIPYREQSFLYCDLYGVKDRILMTYTKPGSVVVLPAGEEKRIWARYEAGNRRYEWAITLDFLEAGQSYWLTDALWETTYSGQVAWVIIPLNEAGIETYTKNIWDRSVNQLVPRSKREDWESYEEYRQFWEQIWQIRKENTNKQLE
jgi:hypothetical protein